MDYPQLPPQDVVGSSVRGQPDQPIAGGSLCQDCRSDRSESHPFGEAEMIGDGELPGMGRWNCQWFAEAEHLENSDFNMLKLAKMSKKNDMG